MDMRRRPCLSAAIFGVVVMSLLGPTLLCAIPNAAPSTEDCCLHMKQECGKANMSACCTLIASNVFVATPALTKKSPTLSASALEHAVLEIAEIVAPVRGLSMPVESQGSGPPRLPSPSSIQVLRI